MKPRPASDATRNLRPPLNTSSCHDVLLVAELDHQPDRLAVAARARQPVAAQRVEAAVGAEQQHLVGRLGMHGEARPVAFLVLELGRRPFRRDGPWRRGSSPCRSSTTVIGSRSTKSSIACSISAGASASSVRRLPSLVLPPNFALVSWTSSAILPHCSLSSFRSARRSLRSAAELLVLALDLELLEPAQRAQAHVEDRLGLRVGELERLDHLGLGLVLLADDLDQPVEVEIGDQVAVEDFQPPLDRGQPEGRAPHQHFAPMVEEGLQRLAQVHDPGRVVLVEDVEVEREADFEVGLPEKLLHQELGRHVAGARLEHDAHVVGQFVAHVFQDRQLLGVDDLGDALDQLALLDLVGNLGDDDAVLAARQLSSSRSARAAGRRHVRSCRPRASTRAARPARRRSGNPAPSPGRPACRCGHWAS